MISKSVYFIVLTVLMLGNAAQAAVVLDQTTMFFSSPNLSSGVGAVYRDSELLFNSTPAQTVTAGVTGTLDSIELSIVRIADVSDAGPLTVEIRSVVDGVPSDDEADLLGMSSVNAEDILDFGIGERVLFDFSTEDIQLNQGDMFAIVISADSFVDEIYDRYAWFGRWDNPYSAGSRFMNTDFNGVTGWLEYVDDDINFATYMNVTAVPIPPAILLFVSGLLFLVKTSGKRGQNIYGVRVL